MKKNFRLVPSYISDTINKIDEDQIIVAVLKSFAKDKIESGLLSHIGLSILNDKLLFSPNVIPQAASGKYSKINRDGCENLRRDLPKEIKTLDMGERPIYGDWSKGSFHLYQDRAVFQKEIVPPKNYQLFIQSLKTEIKNGNSSFLLKIAVSHTLQKSDANFNDQLFFCLNLLQENVGKVEVYPASITNEKLLESRYVNWEILPVGNKDVVIRKILQSFRQPSEEVQKILNDRYDFLDNINPKLRTWVRGLSGNNRYFGALFNDNLIVFENIEYGNAVYVMFEDWETLSKLSRIELLRQHKDKIIKIVHKGDWKEKIKLIIAQKAPKDTPPKDLNG